MKFFINTINLHSHPYLKFNHYFMIPNSFYHSHWNYIISVFSLQAFPYLRTNNCALLDRYLHIVNIIPSLYWLRNQLIIKLSGKMKSKNIG